MKWRKMSKLESKYPNTFYRVSAKAIIMDDQDRILMVKEDSSHDLPGGGIDHGESFKQALKRELNEEVNFDQEIDFDYQILGVETAFKENKQAWLLQIICKVNFEEMPQFSVGKDADEIDFLSKQELAKLENPGAKIAYRWAFGDEKSTVKKKLIVGGGEKCD